MRPSSSRSPSEPAGHPVGISMAMRTMLVLLGGLLLGAWYFSRGLAKSYAPRDWAFVQSVGGITLGTPMRGDKGWHLPVQADASGATTITTEPSAKTTLVCKATRARVEGRTIQLAIITGEPGKGHATPRCPSANLGNIAAGKYQAVYQDDKNPPVPLEEVEIPPR